MGINHRTFHPSPVHKKPFFFDVVDRRYSKDVPNTMILTSNVEPDKWIDFFLMKKRQKVPWIDSSINALLSPCMATATGVQDGEK